MVNDGWGWWVINQHGLPLISACRSACRSNISNIQHSQHTQKDASPHLLALTTRLANHEPVASS